MDELEILMSDEKNASKLPSYRWVPIMDVQIGMVTARPVIAGGEKQSAILIGVGSTVTASTIAQLMNKGIECIAVQVDSAASASEADRIDQVQRYHARLDEIFGATPDENCRLLFDALVKLGPDPS